MVIQNRLMSSLRASLSLVVTSLLLLSGCATRSVNPPIAHYGPAKGYEFGRPGRNGGEPQDLVILVFSGGGTRAAAFSYGVLETLRRIEIVTNSGRKGRMLDEVDVITGVPGGRFTQ